MRESVIIFALVIGILTLTFVETANALEFDSQNLIQLDSPYVEKANAYKGQLHCHTINSDGSQMPSAVLSAYKNAGYNFVAITDHNITTPDPKVDDILFINGMEITINSTHLIALNVTSIPPAENIQTIINQTKEKGGLIWLAHPNLIFNINYANIEKISDYNGIEVYNHITSMLQGSPYAEDKWDNELTNSNQKITAIAVDDCHNIDDPQLFNGAWVTVFANSLSKDEILSNLRNGNFYSSQNPIINSIKVDGTTIKVGLSQTSNITWIGAGGSILQESVFKTEDYYSVQGNEKYVRIRVENSGYAWTNPIYIINNNDRTIKEETIPLHSSFINQNIGYQTPEIQYKPMPIKLSGQPTFTVEIKVKSYALSKDTVVYLNNQSRSIDMDTETASFTQIPQGKFLLSINTDNQTYTEWIKINQNESRTITLSPVQPTAQPTAQYSNPQEQYNQEHQNQIVAPIIAGIAIAIAITTTYLKKRSKEIPLNHVDNLFD